MSADEKELKSGILSADKSADNRPTVGGVNVIAVLQYNRLAFIANLLRVTGEDSLFEITQYDPRYVFECFSLISNFKELLLTNCYLDNYFMLVYSWAIMAYCLNKSYRIVLRRPGSPHIMRFIMTLTTTQFKRFSYYK